jgi:hypothetical protein
MGIAMFKTKVSFDLNIANPEMLREIRAMSPAKNATEVTVAIRAMMKRDRPDVADVEICRQVARSAIEKGIVQLMPPASVLNNVAKAAKTCRTVEDLLQHAAAAYINANVLRPTVVNLRRLLLDLDNAGHIYIRCNAQTVNVDDEIFSAMG